MFRRDAFFRYELPALAAICAAFYLLNAYVRGCDVYGLISDGDVIEIEREALDEMRRKAEQAKEPV